MEVVDLLLKNQTAIVQGGNDLLPLLYTIRRRKTLFYELLPEQRRCR